MNVELGIGSLDVKIENSIREWSLVLTGGPMLSIDILSGSLERIRSRMLPPPSALKRVGCWTNWVKPRSLKQSRRAL